MKLRGALALAVLLSPGLAVAASGAGAIVLAFPVGARYNALGESGVALAQDVSATWFNPGGLAFMADWGKRHDIQLMQSDVATDLADDMGLYSGAVGVATGGGVLAGSLTYLDMGEQLAVDEQQQEKGTFSSYQFVFQGNYAFKLSPTLGFGVGAKYFRDRLAPDSVLQDQGGGSGWSFAFDAGVLWKPTGWNLNLGAAVANIGKDITHVDEDQSDPMPRKATVGAAYQVFQNEYLGLIGVADYQVPLYKWKDNDYGYGFDTSQAEWGAGAEASYARSLFIRLGWKSADYGDINDLTYGFGVDMTRWANAGIRFDFASVPQAEGLSSVKRFSIGYRF